MLIKPNVRCAVYVSTFTSSMFHGPALVCLDVNTYFTNISVLLLYLLWGGLSVLVVKPSTVKCILEMKMKQITKLLKKNPSAFSCFGTILSDRILTNEKDSHHSGFILMWAKS